MRIRVFSAVMVAGLLAIAGVWVASAADRGAESPSASGSPGDGAVSGSRAFRLQFTGNRHAMIRQCDCKSYVGGGADREMTLVKALAAEGLPMVRVDSGGFADSSPIDVSRLKTEYEMQALGALRLDAINVDADDIDVGVRSFLRAARQYSLPVISANLRYRDSGELILPASREVEVRDLSGRELARVGIVGVALEEPPVYPQGYRPRRGLPGDPDDVATTVTAARGEQSVVREYVTAPAEESLRREVARLRPRCTMVVALTCVSLEGARELARKVPGIDVMVAGFEPVEQPNAEGIVEGATRIVSPGMNGVSVGEILVGMDSAGRPRVGKGNVYRLLSEWSYDPEITAVYEASRLATDLTAIVAADQVVRRPYEYAGIDTCRVCHRREFEAWKTSRHARAYDSLRATREEADPLCLSCHTTGYRQPRAFESLEGSSRLAAVDCEACHGPGRDHMAWAYRAWRIRFMNANSDGSLGREVPALPRRATVSDCRACHTTLYDPRFNTKRAGEAIESPSGISAHNLSTFDER